MPSIHTLIPDIYSYVKEKHGTFDEAIASTLGEEISTTLKDNFSSTETRGGLRLSKMGYTCPKALWYSANHPELAEPLPPWALIKLQYGHILEALVLALAKCAGHTVEGEQDELWAYGVRGHRDAVIDGCLVDVKSSTSLSFAKFKDRSIQQNDGFGYLDQLDGYLVGCREDNLVEVKDRGYLLAIDKQLGHMVLYEHYLREDRIKERIQRACDIVASSVIPACECGTVADGKSGNIKLDTVASYSAYKFCCRPGLRTFLYARGPTYLTHVERTPDVPEINQHGQIIRM
jgi:hypothetical protein